MGAFARVADSHANRPWQSRDGLCWRWMRWSGIADETCACRKCVRGDERCRAWHRLGSAGPGASYRGDGTWLRSQNWVARVRSDPAAGYEGATVTGVARIVEASQGCGDFGISRQQRGRGKMYSLSDRRILGDSDALRVDRGVAPRCLCANAS